MGRDFSQGHANKNFRVGMNRVLHPLSSSTFFHFQGSMLNGRRPLAASLAGCLISNEQISTSFALRA